MKIYQRKENPYTLLSFFLLFLCVERGDAEPKVHTVTNVRTFVGLPETG